MKLSGKIKGISQFTALRLTISFKEIRGAKLEITEELVRKYYSEN